jgi:hypothetical protein
MNVGMKFELLAPGVQHAEEANLCAEMSRIASDFQKGVGTGAEQEIVEDLLVLQSQWRQAAGEREDHVQVVGRQKFTPTRGDPPFPSSDLTLRAVAIAAAVIGDGGTMSATGALVDMTAECGGPTPRNGQQHFDVLPAKPMTVSFYESLSRSAEDVGHLERRPIHLLLLRWPVFEL